MTELKPATFTLLRYNPRRAFRGAPAAEVEVQDGNDTRTLWMSRRDIELNIKDFGEHPGLLEARAAYKANKEVER